MMHSCPDYTICLVINMKHLQAEWHKVWVWTHTYIWQIQSPTLSGKPPLVASIIAALRPINKIPWTHHYITYCVLLVKCHLTRSETLRWVTSNVITASATSASNDVCLYTCFCSLFQWRAVCYSRLSKQERLPLSAVIWYLKLTLLFPSGLTNQHDDMVQVTCSVAPN